MNRRSSGRGRLIVAVGALITLAGLPLTWWTIPRTNAPTLYGLGLDGIGIVLFMAALALLAVVVVPFATRDGAASIDRPVIYALLALVAVGAFAWRAYEIGQFTALAMPNQAPGLWLTGLGLVVVAWGVGDIVTAGSGD